MLEDLARQDRGGEHYEHLDDYLVGQCYPSIPFSVLPVPLREALFLNILFLSELDTRLEYSPAQPHRISTSPSPTVGVPKKYMISLRPYPIKSRIVERFYDLLP